jgi:hypothetical protein
VTPIINEPYRIRRTAIASRPGRRNKSIPGECSVFGVRAQVSPLVQIFDMPSPTQRGVAEGCLVGGGVSVGVSDGVRVSVGVRVAVGIGPVMVGVFVGVRGLVPVIVGLGECVGDAVSVRVGRSVLEGVSVIVGVSVGTKLHISGAEHRPVAA